MLASSLASFEEFGTTLTEDALVPKPSTHAAESLTGERQILRAYFGGRQPTGLEISFQRDEIPNSVVELIPEIVALIELRPNWDSYGALSISAKTVAIAIGLISSLLNDQSPSPTLVPTGRGGIKFRWEIRSRYLEIEILPGGRIEAYYIDVSDPSSEIEGDFTGKVSELRRYVEGLINQ